MTENNVPIADSVSRRSVLRKGGAATGALVVAGTVASGSASAQSGGVGFITSRGSEGVHTISGTNEWSVERTPDCNDQGNTQRYPGYETGPFTIFSGTDLEPGEVELHNIRECGHGDLYYQGEPVDNRQDERMWRVNIRPVE